jgi:prepilin-type N-terminal cleavage/methylation domain-containing protein
MLREERGFTMMELVVVLVIITVIFAIAVPNYLRLVQTTQVMQAVADVQTVRTAAYIYFGDKMAWPGETPPGVMPHELASRLPASFAFTTRDYQIDWDNWFNFRGQLIYPATGIGTGVAVVSSNQKLLAELQRMFSKGPAVRISPTKVSLRVAGANGI